MPDANVSAIGAALLGGLAVEAYSGRDVEAPGLAGDYEETIETERGVVALRTCPW